MKQSAFVIAALLGASSAVSIHKRAAPETPTCTNANKATTEDETCSTAGNSAWNTVTSARTAKPADAQAEPYPGHAEHLMLEGVTGSGFKGALDFAVAPATNICTNANKATTEDETCSTAGNSAWNTVSSSRTLKPADAQAEPYPGHTEHIQLNFDSGSSIDHYPPYVPTNGAYPKVGVDVRSPKAPATETQTPPADTAAPEAVGWYKPAWGASGSKTSFGNLAQFDSGSSIDHYPPYVPTNGAYPKVGVDVRSPKAPATETQTPPADTAAPEAVGWYKPAWGASGSKTSFGNLLQLEEQGVTGTGFAGALDFKVSPATNTCTNANKATTTDEDCSTDGNSAWNTISSSRTLKPADAQAEPYPGHAEH